MRRTGGLNLMEGMEGEEEQVRGDERRETADKCLKPLKSPAINFRTLCPRVTSLLKVQHNIKVGYRLQLNMRSEICHLSLSVAEMSLSPCVRWPILEMHRGKDRSLLPLRSGKWPT